MVIPKFIQVYKYIEQELDEQAREDFFRLKKVLDNKKKHAEEEEEIADHAEGGDKHAEESQNLLDDVDEDIIFWSWYVMGAFCCLFEWLISLVYRLGLKIWSLMIRIVTLLISLLSKVLKFYPSH